MAWSCQVTIRKAGDEAHLPTEQPEACPQARVPAPHVHPRRTCGLAGAPQAGPSPTFSLIPLASACQTLSLARARLKLVAWRSEWSRCGVGIEFLALRRSRRRARSGPVAVHYVPAPPLDEVPRISYSVPRRVGSAVDRNRWRRRLRAVAYEAAPSLPPGAYLIGVEPDVRDVSFQELRRRVIEAIERASGGAGS